MEHRRLSPWKGAVAGGLIVFAWSAFSWLVLPFHNRTVLPFGDPAALAIVMEAGAARPGVYVVAGDPFLFVSYAKGGAGSPAAKIALGLLLQMAGAFFWTWILGKIPGLTLKDAARYGLFFGLCVGALGDMPYWVCWEFPLPFAAMYVVDAAVAWTLASMALSRCRARS